MRAPQQPCLHGRYPGTGTQEEAVMSQVYGAGQAGDLKGNASAQVRCCGPCGESGHNSRIGRGCI